MRVNGPIHVRGLGLACALGQDVRTCAAALEARAIHNVPLALDELVEAVSMRFYRIADGSDVFETARFRPLLQRAAREAVLAAELTRQELDDLPLFMGSSCFSFGKTQDQYDALHRSASTALDEVPLIGFETLARFVQDDLRSGGHVYGFNTACTASANALMVAMRSIRLGVHAHALVVGVELANQTTLAGFSGLQLVSDTVRPFDKRRGGIVLGEGVGAVVLSARQGAGGMTLVAGACNGDAYSVTAANPDGSTIAAVQTEALRQGGVAPESVRGIKCHGTASPLNDTGEAAGILRVFREPPPVCALKPYVGHTLGACGAIELALLASALERGFFPATPGFEEPDPELGLAPSPNATDARAGHYLLNYFGFGGNNASLLVHQS